MVVALSRMVRSATRKIRIKTPKPNHSLRAIVMVSLSRASRSVGSRAITRTSPSRAYDLQNAYSTRRTIGGKACLAARQVDGEGCPFAQTALDGDPAAVVLGYVLDYGEPQA